MAESEAATPIVVPNDELLEWPKKDKRRFLHAVYRVGDLDRTIKFYTEGLGMKLLRKRDIPDEKYSNAFLGFGPEESQFVVELTYNYGVDKYDIGTGFGHFAIATPDVYKFVENANGVHVTVRQLIIYSSEVIESIRTEYDKSGQSEWSDRHGREVGTRNTIKLDYPNEFLISVSGNIGVHNALTVICSLTLKSNRRTYGPFGIQRGNYFEFPSSNGNKIIGFHGSSGYHLDSIGAYLSTQEIQWVSIGPYGGKGGDRWYDGVYTTIRRLIIYSSEMIESIRTEYDKNGQSKWSDTHGREVGTINTIKLDYPNEFLISISGYVGVHNGLTLICSLTLKSNRRTYGPFGTQRGNSFEFPTSSGNKIIGFHGSSGDHLDSIGAYSKPI